MPNGAISKTSRENPAITAERREREQIAEARRCVELLATPDFINSEPGYEQFKPRLKPYQGLIRRASDIRAELRNEADARKMPWLVGAEEYEVIERRTIQRLGPVMSQFAFQNLLNAYYEQKKKESIARWNAGPIRILQCGLPS